MKVVEIRGNDKYDEWMRQNDGKYKIAHVAVTNLSSNAWPALASAYIGGRTFTITFEEKR
jgi:hypothetical protein